MPEFLEEQVTEVKEQFTQVIENEAEVITPRGVEFVQQESVIQEQFTEVQENIDVIEQRPPGRIKAGRRRR